MTTHADATFALKNWDGKPYNEVPSPKFTRAHVSRTFEGGIEGEGTLEYLMFYGEAKTTFTGLEKIVGRVGGRSGSFALQHTGSDDGSGVQSTWTVIPGSGTGELRGLRGQGSGSLSGHQERYPFSLDYDFE